MQRVIEWDPNNWAAHLYLGDNYVEKGLYEQAIKEYDIPLNSNNEGPEDFGQSLCPSADGEKERGSAENARHAVQSR